jgi:AraC family transcriptional regulator, exoenzyme S synthesis regulatory protein ExsA
MMEMDNKGILSCHLGPEISPEQFVRQSFFLYLLKGRMTAYDGETTHEVLPGDACLIRRNHLLRYTKKRNEGAFQKIVIILDEAFLKKFRDKFPFASDPKDYEAALTLLPKSSWIDSFVGTLEPFLKNANPVDLALAELKREEFLLLLMKAEPGLARGLFEFGAPEKINLEGFMNQNFRFNVDLERFSYLTGRSLSSFKRDFHNIFKQTPARWLTMRRLQEAYFLMKEKGQKPNDVYQEVGFENFSHFSFAFRRQFGVPPSEVR